MIDWKTYNPDWLVKLARKHMPADHFLIDAIADCTRCYYGDQEIYFMDPEQVDDSGYLRSPRPSG